MASSSNAASHTIISPYLHKREPLSNFGITEKRLSMISEQFDVYGNHNDNRDVANSSQISVSDAASLPAVLQKKLEPKPIINYL
jgi:hypothetical protein